MKVYVSGDSLEALALRRRFEIQEDELTDLKQANVVIELPTPVRLPNVAVEGLFGSIGKGRPYYFVSRYFHGEWHKQSFVGIPLTRFMNDDLGAEVDAGCMVRFVLNAREDLFCDKGFLDFLRLSKRTDNTSFHGFVSIVFDEHGEPLWIEKSIPFLGLFAVAESLRCRLSQFFADPMNTEMNHRFWYTSLLVSRFPFPAQSTHTRTLVEGVTRLVENHFWAFAERLQKGSFYSLSTRLGVATGWSDTLSDACERTLVTARKIVCPFVQFRTDLLKTTAPRFDRIKPRL